MAISSNICYLQINYTILNWKYHHLNLWKILLNKFFMVQYIQKLAYVPTGDWKVLLVAPLLPSPPHSTSAQYGTNNLHHVSGLVPACAGWHGRPCLPWQLWCCCKVLDGNLAMVSTKCGVCYAVRIVPTNPANFRFVPDFPPLGVGSIKYATTGPRRTWAGTYMYDFTLSHQSVCKRPKHFKTHTFWSQFHFQAWHTERKSSTRRAQAGPNVRLKTTLWRLNLSLIQRTGKFSKTRRFNDCSKVYYRQCISSRNTCGLFSWICPW